MIRKKERERERASLRACGGCCVRERAGLLCARAFGGSCAHERAGVVVCASVRGCCARERAGVCVWAPACADTCVRGLLFARACAVTVVRN